MAYSTAVVTLKVRGLIVGLGLIVLATIAIELVSLPGPHSPSVQAGPAVSVNSGQARPAVPARRLGRREQDGFPGASDTGVAAGIALRSVPAQVSSGPGWRFDPAGWVQVYGKGAVLSGLYIPYNVNVTGSDVTIKNDRIVTGGPDAIGISLRHAHDVTIEDSTISGANAGNRRIMAGIKDVYGDSTGVSVLDNDIFAFETGIQLESGLIQGNYLHDPGYIAGDHTNGIMSNGGATGLLTIEHNTILIDRGQTDAIGLFEDFGVQRNRHIIDNLLAGGGYAIYAGQNPGGPPTSNIVIAGNQISTIYYARGGYYGCAAHFNSQGSKNVWSDNMWNATLASSYSACD
jgi:hypothetical protein